MRLRSANAAGIMKIKITEFHIERFQRLKALYNLIKEDWACNAQIIAYKSIADKQQKQNFNKHIQHGRTKHSKHTHTLDNVPLTHTHTGAHVCDMCMRVFWSRTTALSVYLCLDWSENTSSNRPVAVLESLTQPWSRWLHSLRPTTWSMSVRHTAWQGEKKKITRWKAAVVFT